MTERTAVVRLRAVITDFQAAYARAGTSVKGLQREIETGAAANKAGMEKVSRGALLLGGAALAGVGMAVRAFANFDHEMSAVHAATQEGVVGMRQLRDAAIEAGQKTVFSATEAAQAETELAKAGVSTADILGGGLTGALSLAAAGQLEVADSAEIAATAMTQFGLAGSDIPHIADLLAAGAGKAQGEVSDLAAALKFVAPVAHGMGVSIEETIGTLAMFAKQGIIGEQAGTGLRGVLLSLTSPGKQAAEQMKALGINLYDSTGAFVGVDGAAQQLHDALKPLSPAARDAALGIMFGNQQVTAARVLYEGGATSVEKWTKAVNDQGYAAKVAADKMDNLVGDVNNFQSSLETALIKGGGHANIVLRGMTKSATGLVNSFAEMPGPLQATAVGLVAVSGAVLLVGGSIGFLGPRIVASRLALEGLGRSGKFASTGIGWMGKLGTYGAIAATAAIGISELQKQIDRLTGNGPIAVDALTRSLLQFTETGTAAGDLAGMFGKDLNDLGHQATEVESKFGKAQGVFESLVPGGSGSKLEEYQKNLDAVDAALTGLVQGGHADAAKAIFDELSAGMSKVEAEKFKTQMDGYTNALANTKTETKLAAGEQSGLSGGLDQAALAAKAAEEAVTGYKAELDALNGINITAYEQQTALARSFKDLTAATKKAGKVTLDERDALSSFAQQANDTSKAIIDQTGNSDKANRVMETSRKRFIAAAEAAGYTRDQAKKLADAMLHLPGARTIPIKTPGMQAAIDAAANLAWQINHIPKSVTVGIFNKVQNIPVAGHRAGGGPVTSGRTYLVGEDGEEWFTPKQDGYITPHGAFTRAGKNSSMAFGNIAPPIGAAMPGIPQPLPQPKIVTGGKEARDLGDGFGKVTDQVRKALKALQDFQDRLSNNVAIDAFVANASLAKSYHDLAKAMKDGGRVTNDEKIALGGFAADAKAAAAAVLELTKSQGKANAAMRKGRREFIALAMDAGYSRKQAKALADRLGLTAGARAGGGSVAAGATYKVGESGTELFTPTRPGYITTNGAMTRAAAAGGSSFQAGGVRLHRDDLAALATLIARRPDTVVELDRRVLARAVDAQNHDDRLLR